MIKSLVLAFALAAVAAITGCSAQPESEAETPEQVKQHQAPITER